MKKQTNVYDQKIASIKSKSDGSHVQTGTAPPGGSLHRNILKRKSTYNQR